MTDFVFYECPHGTDKRHVWCLMCHPQDALDSRTVAMYAANEAANRYKADADRLAEALRDIEFWLRAEVAAPRANPHPAMLIQAAAIREALRQHDAAKEASDE